MTEQTNSTDQLENHHKESTYALLIRSEEKSRNFLEIAIHSLLIIGALMAIWQFVHQAVGPGMNPQDTRALLDRVS